MKLGGTRLEVQSLLSAMRDCILLGKTFLDLLKGLYSSESQVLINLDYGRTVAPCRYSAQALTNLDIFFGDKITTQDPCIGHSLDRDSGALNDNFRDLRRLLSIMTSIGSSLS